MVKERCSLCNKELDFRYNLSKHGVQGFICSSCYSRKLKEIYGIKH